MARPDVILVERMTILAGLVKGLAMSGVARESAGPGGLSKRRRNRGCEHHGGDVFFSPAEICGRRFVRLFDARPRARMRRKVPPPRQVRWEDACLSTGIAGEGFGQTKQAHWSSSGKVRIG